MAKHIISGSYLFLFIKENKNTLYIEIIQMNIIFVDIQKETEQKNNNMKEDFSEVSIICYTHLE